VRAKRVRLDAVCAAAVALVAARVWLVLAPGQAVRWGSRSAERDVTGRGSRGSFTGRGFRGSGEDPTGRGLRGSHFDYSGFFPLIDLRDPRPEENSRDSRPVKDPRDPRPVRSLRDPRPVRSLRDPRPAENSRDPRPVKDLRDPRPVRSLRDPRPVKNPRAARSESKPQIRDLSNAVMAVGARRPFSATCLEQSVALVILLSIARIPAHLVVGVARAESTFRAHAWVECCGDVVLGGAQAEGLTPLLRAPATSPSAAASSCPG
jgi:Transglutaminase-like superfamily